MEYFKVSKCSWFHILIFCFGRYCSFNPDPCFSSRESRPVDSRQLLSQIHVLTSIFLLLSSVSPQCILMCSCALPPSPSSLRHHLRHSVLRCLSSSPSLFLQIRCLSYPRSTSNTPPLAFHPFQCRTLAILLFIPLESLSVHPLASFSPSPLDRSQ